LNPWREHSDPWEEAERLEVASIARRLGWGKRRLTNELNRAGSPEFFVKRMIKLAQDLDRPRLLHRDPAKPPTDNPALAAKGEGEMVPKWYEDDLARENRAKDTDRRMATNAERKKRPLDRRLVLCLAESQRRGIAIGSQLGAIERQIERIERRLDKV
jgi:hypothetical protein